ncbi:MAG: glycosyltransferase [Chlamydiia bacterium]|nr:glycosyltransferase [Chlamydiia bacterium]
MILLLLFLFPGLMEIGVLSFAALFYRQKREVKKKDYRTLIVIPAHNEEQGIAKCLKSLPNDVDKLVIADNCTDRTAHIAKQLGAIVYERQGKPGKPHALEEALPKYQNYDITLFIDADSTVSANLVHIIESAVSNGAQAVQVRYHVDQGPSLFARYQQIAFAGMNHIRAKGRSALGLSAGIFGNGFALTKEVLATAPFTSHALAEDTEYHLKLTCKGFRVHYRPQATVTATTPPTLKSATHQHHRWLVGRLTLIKSWCLPLIQHKQFEPLFDLLTLPTSVYVLFIPLFPFTAIPLSLYFFLSWMAVRPRATDLLLPFQLIPYLLWKVMITLFRPTKLNWRRTSRGSL